MYVAQADLELVMQTKIALNSEIPLILPLPPECWDRGLCYVTQAGDAGVHSLQIFTPENNLHRDQSGVV